MTLSRRRFLELAAATTLLPAGTSLARAQTFPTRPIRIVIGYPAGGSTDLLARIVGQYLSERLGQTFVIENKPGAGTNLAAQTVVAAPPDGYTLLFAASTYAINATLYDSLPYNFLRDIVPIAGLAELPLVLDVNTSLPVNTLAEFISYAKANPGKISFASFGAGTIAHLAIELLKQTTGIDVVHVPYRGGAPFITDLLAGRVQAGIDALPNSLPHIKSGTVRALAVLPAQRATALPDVPAISETLPGFAVSTWSGVGAPRGTPPEIIERLNREINAALMDPGIKARIAEIGGTPLVYSPAEFDAVIRADTEKWAKVIRTANIKPE
jgi:tripartite-type tricarboxylate transporter receptor subunit TctC